MGNLLEPDVLADVHVLFPADRSKPPQFFCTKPDETSAELILHIMNGTLGALADFAVSYSLNLSLRCPSCQTVVPMVQPRPQPG